MTQKNEIIYWAENEAEAVVIMAMLEEYGIPCQRLQESYGANNSLSFGIFGQIAIAVEADRVKEAEALILSMDEAEDTDEDSEDDAADEEN